MTSAPKTGISERRILFPKLSYSSIKIDKRYYKLVYHLQQRYAQYLFNLKLLQIRCGLMLRVLGERKNWDQVRNLQRCSKC